MALSAPKATGDILAPADIVGHLLAVIPTEFVADIPTVRGPSDAIRVDVSVMTAQDADGNHGVVYRDVLWFNTLLRSSLRKQIGETVLGRMGTGVAKPGQDAPFILVNAMDDAEAVAFTEAWLAAHPEFEKVAANSISGQSATPAVSAPAQATPAAASVPSTPAVPATPKAAPAPAALPTPAAAAPAPVADPAALLAALSPTEQAALAAMIAKQQAQ